MKNGTCIHEEIVKTRDGIYLTTFVVLPEPCDKKYPLVIDRSPYGPDIDLLPAAWIPDGFGVVAQNQRGCFTSGGTYNFWKQDGQDAYDTMEHLLTKNFSNGDIFTAGASADGCSAIMDYIEPNPYIKGSNIIWATGFAHETCYWGGAYRSDLITHWLSDLGKNTCPGAKQVEMEVRQNEVYNAWWSGLQATGPFGNHLPNVDAPGVMLAGWWDIFQAPNLRMFDEAVAGANETVRDKWWLWVDPGGHCSSNEFTEFGWPKFFDLHAWERASTRAFEEDWEDKIFKEAKRINVYVMASVPKILNGTKEVGNYWTSFDAWPTFTPQQWYLSVDGTVGPKPPQDADGSKTFTYNPKTPAPAIGANTLFSSSPCGPRDLREKVASRSDVLQFEMAEALTETIAIVGKITATITVSSSAIDTDFYVTLTDRYPGGELLPVRYGAVKMRWRNGPFHPENMRPGQLYEIQIDMWSTAYIFNPGHKLGVLVTSSRAPEFTVNPNNGYPLFTQDQGPVVIANNTVHMGYATGLSRVTLPVVNIADIPVNPLI